MSQNGVQHLCAMTLDEEIGRYVNLVPSDTPGDLYSFVAEKLWEQLEYEEAKLPAAVYDRFDEIFNTTVELQRKYEEAPYKSDLKATLWEELQTYRNNNRQLREWLFPVYWNRIKDPKIRRKIAKRPTMTISYGSVPYGMGQQIWDDSRPINDYLSKQEKLWSSMLGRLLHQISRKELKGPGRLLGVFETLADRFNEQEKSLSWVVPFTNFPVIQDYRKPGSNRTHLKHGDNVLQVVIENWDEPILDKDSQKLGASPNIVHSLDAAHMMLVLDAVDFDVACVHDSWGCIAGNMSDLFYTVRDQFRILHKSDPLKNILRQLDSEDLLPERGSLDLDSIMESDFAFC